MQKLINLFRLRPKVDLKIEILAGITVALALVPESIAFALIAGLSPLVGLYAAFVIGLVTAVFGGRPGMISGATGAVAVIFITLVQSHGVEYVFATVVLAGIIQVLTGLFKLGKFIRLVPQPVIYGFVNGLALIIFSAQLDQFKDATGAWLTGSPLFVILGLVSLTMAIIWLLPKLTKAVPSSLVAILAVFGIVFFGGIDTKTVGDIASIQGGFPPFHIPLIAWNMETFMVIFPYALMVASVGLIESLLTLNIIDEITETRGKVNKEAIAQGGANILSGMFSGMGGCAMLGQSMINVSSGSRARLSGIVASLTLLMFIMFGSSVIELVPMAALTGVMIMVSIGTFEWASFRVLTKFPKSDIIVMVLVTVATILLHNLALAVIAGVIISALVFAWDSAQRIQVKKYTDEAGVKHYEPHGPLFFGSTISFAEQFDISNDPQEIIIDFAESRVVDMSAIETLNKLTERYLKVGKVLHLKHLSHDCRTLIHNANAIVDINMMEDPTYPVVA